ncbi:helicase-related protein [Lentisphaerota bacterium WC36G]|nr:DEAD/DEAH box helicase family protein [Lentisphaerae bacterium WC36]
MNSLSELSIKQSYDSSIDNILEDFYYPVLGSAYSYDRIAGYFTSSSLVISARGISGLLSNNGKIRLIVSPVLDKKDAEEINLAQSDPKEYIIKNFESELKKVDILDIASINHIKALGYLIATNHLEIKIALIYRDGDICSYEKVNTSALFHQKIGIISDGENSISFSGSINETASAWTNNIEEFKTFRSWNTHEKIYFLDDKKKFEDLWNGARKNIKLISLPDAIKKKFVEFSKGFRNESISVKSFNKSMQSQRVIDSLSLFDFQKKAVKMWLKNGCKLLFEMATGTGKTRTAIGCIAEIMQKGESLLVIVSSPQNTLSRQWIGNISEFDLCFDESIIADSSNRLWKKKAEPVITKLKLGYYKSVIFYSTHSTCSSLDFINIVKNSQNKYKILFIGDETHGLGSTKQQNGLQSNYEYRIGLSATPQRWFDDYGSHLIENYYGKKSFEFTIEDALKTINPVTHKPFLVNYYYFIRTPNLSQNELEKYEKISTKIKRLKRFNTDDIQYQEYLQNLIFQRANILKNAQSKYEELKLLLDDIKDIENTIIFVSPEQIEKVSSILADRNIIAHKFTQLEGTVKSEKYNGLSEREHIIKNFKNGNYKVLVAIKCLDEGIDIPSATTAILMSSNSNPREYIQRIGRVIRQSDNKENAHIYDFVVKPRKSLIKDSDLKKFEREIFEKEYNRISYLASNALNNTRALAQAHKLLENTYE